MDEASLLALHHHLKSGAPRGRTGGMGLGVQRARKVVGVSDLPDNKLYKNFVREGAVLTEEEWLGGPKFEGKRETFEEEEEVEAEGAAAGGAAAAAAAAPAPALTLKAMKALVRSYLQGCKGCRAKLKFVRSVAVEEATGGAGGEEEEAAAGALFEKAVRKLVKKGSVLEAVEQGSSMLQLVAEQQAEKEEEVAAKPASKRSKRS
jgi:hypothetical protein